MTTNRKHENHHFVSQFYLRHWCDENGRLWVYPKSGAEPFQSTPKSFSCEKGLYDTSTHDELSDVDVEGLLSEMEGLYSARWPNVFSRIRDPETKMNLARFLAIQYLRNPKQKESLKTTNGFIREIISRLDPGQKELTIIDFDKREHTIPIAELTTHAQDTKKNISDGFIRSLMGDVMNLAEVLYARKWGVLVAATPAFVTSDNPVILIRGSSTKRNIGFRTPGTEIHFPITPTLLLIIKDEWKRDGMFHNLTSLGGVNNEIMEQSERFAFGRRPLKRRNGNLI